MWPQRVDCFPANSVTIYLPASWCFLFALSDTFHYSRWPPDHSARPGPLTLRWPPCLVLTPCSRAATSTPPALHCACHRQLTELWAVKSGVGVAFSSLREWHFRMQFLHLLASRFSFGRSSSFSLHSFNAFPFCHFLC